MMRNFWIIAIIALAFSACRKEDTATLMAKDVCACIMPVVEEQDRMTEVLKRGNQAEIDALEAEAEKNQEKTAECFKNLESRHGNMEAYQKDIMEIMKKRCPRAAALLSGDGN